MNLTIREFKLTLENYINGNALPPEVKRIILKEIYESAEAVANAAIAAELENREKAEGMGKDE